MRCSSFHAASPWRFAASLGALLCVALVAAATVGAAEVEPYTVRIVTPGAPVHSGPGAKFYATDTLAQGETVEVYREQPGGWLGIRPPADSFSWIFGRHVKLLDDGLAEIDKDDVPSRIGSRLGQQRNAVQVRLEKGEVVEIISEEIVGGETWYKIAPPSGEFRWIHARNVARPAGEVSSESANVDAPMEPAKFVAAVGPTEHVPPPIVTVPIAGESGRRADAVVTLAAHSQSAPTPPADPETWRPSAASPMATDAASLPAAAASPPAAQSEDRNRQTANAPTNNAPPATSAVAPRTPHTAADNGLARQLMDVELRLSRIVAEHPTAWQIAPLRQEANQLLAAATTDSERAAVNTSISKLDRFAAIAGRYQQLAASAGSGDPRTTSISPDTRHLTPDTFRYDAVGILRPVVSKRPGAPQFALVDERGQVAAFVTPTPDLNLQPFLGHRIGITGSRGYIPEFQRAHVTAGRVSPLNERMIR